MAACLGSGCAGEPNIIINNYYTDADSGDTGEEVFEWDAPAATVSNAAFVSDLFHGETPNTYWLLCTPAQTAAYNEAVDQNWNGGWGYIPGELYDSSNRVTCDALVVKDGGTGAVTWFTNIVITPAGDSTANYMSASTFSPVKLRLDEGEGNEGRCINTPEGDCVRNFYLRPDATTNTLGRVVVAKMFPGFPMKDVSPSRGWLYLNVWTRGPEPVNLEADFDREWRERHSDDYGGEKPAAVIKGQGDLSGGWTDLGWEIATASDAGEELAQEFIDSLPDFILNYDPSIHGDFYSYASSQVDFDETNGGWMHFWAQASAGNVCDSYSFNNMVYVVEDSGLLGKSLASQDYSLGFCGPEYAPFMGYSDGADSLQTACFQDETCFERAVAVALEDTRALIMADPVGINAQDYDELQSLGMARESDASAFARNESYLINLVTTALPKLGALSQCYDLRPVDGVLPWTSADGQSGEVYCPYASWGSGERMAPPPASTNRTRQAPASDHKGYTVGELYRQR
ncbi:hypothetical protein IPG41_05475 [Candidatus Peregrinibacteria bacterium]|nr:MAG: hypothetical protein IPG41_05475 [Candidatus Peregrinibacteria bacterium]